MRRGKRLSQTKFYNSVLAVADMPVRSKLLNMKGHNGKHPCSTCSIEGIYVPSSNHYYYPLIIPRDLIATNREKKRTSNYLPDNLPTRLDREVRVTTDRIAKDSTLTARQRDDLQRGSGIIGFSQFGKLRSIDLVHSFPADGMHAWFVNMCRDMYNL